MADYERPYQAPPQPKTKKKHRFLKVLAAFAGIIVLIVIISTLANGGGDQAPAPGPADQVEQADQPKKSYGIDDPVKSGDVTFTVTDVDTEQSVSGPLGTEKARGKYVIVDISVKNNGADAFDFFAADVPLVDQKDNNYTSTEDVALARSSGTDLLEPINPGSTAKGFIAYDVPESVKVKKSHIEVSGGWLAEPVSVRLDK